MQLVVLATRWNVVTKKLPKYILFNSIKLHPMSKMTYSIGGKIEANPTLKIRC